MRIWFSLILAAVLLVSLCTVAGIYAKSQRTISRLTAELAAAKASQQNLLRNKVNSVRTGNVRVRGKIEADEAVALSPRFTAPIARVCVKDGAVVNAGDLLLELDSTDARADLSKCISAQSAAQRLYDDLQREFPDRERLYCQAVEELDLLREDTVAKFSMALSDVRQRKVARDAELEEALTQWERARRLHQEGLTPKSELDHAAWLLETRRAAAEADHYQYNVLERRTGPSEDNEFAAVRKADLERERDLRRIERERILDIDLVHAQTALEECRLKVTLADRNLQATQVRAPVRGIVTAACNSPRLASLRGSTALNTGRALSFEELREPGKLVGPEDVLFVLEGLDAVVVKASIDEIDINRVHLGDTVQVTGVGFPGVTLTGEVATISPKATYVAEGVTTFDTTFRIRDPLGEARFGMTAEVEILIGGGK